MKQIVLHGPALDNAGNFQDAGSELEIGDDAKDGVISLDRANELVGRGAALSLTAEKRSNAAADDAFDPSPFNVATAGIGRYDITGPGLDGAENIRGKAAMRARVAELLAALPPVEPPTEVAP